MRDIKEIEQRYRDREEKKGKVNLFKKRYLIILIVVLALILKPGKEAHRKEVEVKISETLKVANKVSTVGTSSETDSEQSLVGQVVDSYLSYSDYYLFSTMSINWNGKSSVMSIGAFGMIFIPLGVDGFLNDGEL